MAGRANKAARQLDKSRATSVATAEDEVASLMAERDALASQLSAAKTEIALLKDRHTQVINQIDWVLDSLHTISDDEK